MKVAKLPESAAQLLTNEPTTIYLATELFRPVSGIPRNNIVAAELLIDEKNPSTAVLTYSRGAVTMSDRVNLQDERLPKRLGMSPEELIELTSKAVTVTPIPPRVPPRDLAGTDKQVRRVAIEDPSLSMAESLNTAARGLVAGLAFVCIAKVIDAVTAAFAELSQNRRPARR